MLTALVFVVAVLMCCVLLTSLVWFLLTCNWFTYGGLVEVKEERCISLGMFNVAGITNWVINMS
jgi:hypothetical protein